MPQTRRVSKRVIRSIGQVSTPTITTVLMKEYGLNNAAIRDVWPCSQEVMPLCRARVHDSLSTAARRLEAGAVSGPSRQCHHTSDRVDASGVRGCSRCEPTQ